MRKTRKERFLLFQGGSQSSMKNTSVHTCIVLFPRFAEYMRKIKEGKGLGGADQEFVDKTYADWMAGKGASPCSVFNKNYKTDCRSLSSSPFSPLFLQGCNH